MLLFSCLAVEMKCSSAKVGTPYSKSRSTLFEASDLSENEAAYNP
jgi:hypothetical protein